MRAGSAWADPSSERSSSSRSKSASSWSANDCRVWIAPATSGSVGDNSTASPGGFFGDFAASDGADLSAVALSSDLPYSLALANSSQPANNGIQPKSRATKVTLRNMVVISWGVDFG